MSQEGPDNELPATWALAPLADIGVWRGGGTPSKADPSFWTDGTIPWISPKDMKVERILDTEDHITEEAVSASATNLLDPGSVVVVTRSGILQRTFPVAVTAVPAALNQDLKALSPYPGIDASYVAYALRQYEDRILRECSKQGTTVQSIEFPSLLRFTIPLAPLPEQHRIVAEIETQLTRLEAAIAALERARANLKRYRAAVLKAACEGRLVPTEAELARAEGRTYEPASLLLERARQDYLPKAQRGRRDLSGIDANGKKLPDGWAWATMPLLGELNRGKSKHRPRNDARLLDGPYPFIQTGDVRHSGGWIRSHSQTYSEFGLAQSRLWPAGTLCITIAANIAETGILTYPACFPDSVVGFRYDGDSVTVRFVELFLRTARQELEHYAPATAQKNINLDVLSEVLFPLPPLAEQHRIVAEVERRLSVVEELERAVAHGLTRAEMLRQAILRRAFEGKLVPQDPADEPASALLARIRAERESNGTGPAKRRRVKEAQPRLL